MLLTIIIAGDKLWSDQGGMLNERISKCNLISQSSHIYPRLFEVTTAAECL